MAPDAYACKEIFWKKEHDWLKWSWPAPNGPNTSSILFEVWFLPSLSVLPACSHECHFFNSLGNFCSFSGLVWRVYPFKKWQYHLFPPPLLPHLYLLSTTLQTYLNNIFTPLPIHFQKPSLPVPTGVSNWNYPNDFWVLLLFINLNTHPWILSCKLSNKYFYTIE